MASSPESASARAAPKTTTARKSPTGLSAAALIADDGPLFFVFEDLREIGIVRNRTNLADIVRCGEFPQPIRMSRRYLWVADEVRAWRRARLAERHYAPQAAKPEPATT
jgi:hypothetical protein